MSNLAKFSASDLDQAAVYLQYAYELCVDHAGPLIQQAFAQRDKQVMIKGDKSTDLVTETDQKVEKELIGALKKKYPSHGFIGEESTAAEEEQAAKNKSNKTGSGTGTGQEQKKRKKEEWIWIIDPVDGTTNFVHGHAEVCICVGLALNGELIAGIVYNPILRDVYTGISSRGAFRISNLDNLKQFPKLPSSQSVKNFKSPSPLLRVERLSVSKSVSTLPQALVCTEMGSDRTPRVLEHVQRNLLALVSKPNPVHSIRCCGSAAMNMCHVARGSCDAYYEYGIHCWDIAAAMVVVCEAGGVVVDAPVTKKQQEEIHKTGKLKKIDIMKRRVLAACNEDLAKEIAAVIYGHEFPSD
eukprot:Nk52_evm1s43 gene=Nk52_evmTU1s43